MKVACPVPPRETVSVPVVSLIAIPKVEVATYDGAPVVKEVWRMVPPEDEATLAKLVAELA